MDVVIRDSDLKVEYRFLDVEKIIKESHGNRVRIIDKNGYTFRVTLNYDDAIVFYGSVCVIGCMDKE